MKVGDKVWLFDTNRRVYPKGSITSAPIYAEHFYQTTIDDETPRSWIIGRQKYSKKGGEGIYTDEQKADRLWDHANRYNIIEKVKECSVEKLKQIEEILK